MTQGLFFNTPNEVFVVSKSKIRKYVDSNSPSFSVWTRTSRSALAASFTKDKRIAVVSYDATNLFFEFYDPLNFNTLTYHFKTLKGYSGLPEPMSKLATSGTFGTTLYLC